MTYLAARASLHLAALFAGAVLTIHALRWLM